MKILIIVNELPPDFVAGTAMSTFYLSQHLNRHGHEVHVAVTMKKKETMSVERINGVYVHRFEPVNMKLTRMLQRFLWLHRVALNINPDIIQGQAISCGMHAALIGKLIKKPSITYIQGYDLYHSSVIQKLTEIRFALKYADAVLAVSPDLQQKAHDVSSRSDIVIMPHGLEVEAEDVIGLKPESFGMEAPFSHKKNILFVGRLNNQKGLIYLIDAVKSVSGELRDVRLLLIGEGDQRAALQERADKLALADIVYFLGPKSHTEIMTYMSSADIFVLPSLEEPFGIVLLEAMHRRLPVVATNVQGIPYIIKEGRNGLLVSPRDSIQLADRIVYLLQNSSIRAAMGDNNFKDSQQYRWENLVERYLSLYRNLLLKRGITAA
ncbi:MAG: glycosyltransferase family 4 protein [Deltaproteobacteria bacterium]|nr:glycosyltransferase family 4 protein [Deltaproteobacteria bacterium]